MAVADCTCHLAPGIEHQTRVKKLPGEKRYTRNAQILTSSGSESLDSIIGGGIPVGSIILVEEDLNGSYAKLLLRYYISEGIASHHGLFICGDSVEEELLNKLPGIEETSLTLSTESPSTADLDKELKIAWKYRHLPVHPSSTAVSKRGYSFDLSKCMDPQLIKNSNVEIFEMNNIVDVGSSVYGTLLNNLSSYIDDNGFSEESFVAEKSTILRICLHAFGSPVWNGAGDPHMNEFCKFLYAVRALVRFSLATCFITIPVDLLKDNVQAARIEKLCDIVLRLDSFAGSTKDSNTAFVDYQGLLHLIKVPTLNSISKVCHSSSDFAFKLRRRKLTIETLHLPPDIPEPSDNRKDEYGCTDASFGFRENIYF